MASKKDMRRADLGISPRIAPENARNVRIDQTWDDFSDPLRGSAQGQ